LPVISSDCCPGPRWLTLFAVSDFRRDTREHLMLGFSEKILTRASVVTSAPGDQDPYRGDRRVAGRSPLEQAPF